MLGAVSVRRERCELRGVVLRQSRVAVRHVFHDVHGRQAVVQLAADGFAARYGFVSIGVGDAGPLERGEEVCVVAAGIAVRRHGQADYSGEARKHCKQSHRFILVQIGAVVLPSVLAESIRDSYRRQRPSEGGGNKLLDVSVPYF